MTSRPTRSSESNIHTSEILDSQMWRPNYTTDTGITKSSNPAPRKDAIASRILDKDTFNQISAPRVIGIVFGNSTPSDTTIHVSLTPASPPQP